MYFRNRRVHLNQGAPAAAAVAGENGAVTPPAEATTPSPAVATAVAPAAAAPATAAATAAPAGETASEKRLAEALARVEKLELANRTNLVARVAAEMGLKPEAAEFLTGADEAALRAQATKLKGFAPSEAPAVGAVGTTTKPGAVAAGPTLEERIATAEKTGSKYESIELKLRALAGEE